MSATVVMFSGQGSQKIGMGKEFYDASDICRRTFDEASEALDFDIAKLCFEANNQLSETEFAQPALLTVSIAVFRLMASRGFSPDIAMGLSLGEYTALTAAGVFDFADAVRLVRLRGSLMSKHTKPGGMLVSIGLGHDVLLDICKKAAPLGFVACANFNTAEQIVLSGEFDALDFCTKEIKAAGGKAISLAVSGPFHTPLLSDAADRFKEALIALTVSQPKIPVVSNLTGDLFDISNLTDSLANHMISPVLWVDCVKKALSLGAKNFVELGSGKTLTNFAKKISTDNKVFAIETPADMEGYCE